MESFLLKRVPPLYWRYHKLRNHPWIWEYLLNQKSRAVWHRVEHSLELDTVQQRVVNGLRTEGIAIVHFSELFPSSSLFNELEAYGNKLWKQDAIQSEIAEAEKGNIKAKDDIIIHMLGGYSGQDMPELVLNDPYMHFNLDERIVAIAGSYLGVAPRFRMFSLHSTILVPEGSRAQFSQRWHRDPDDRKIVKVFLYVNDVDEGTGPFTYVKDSHEGGKWRSFHPQLFPVGSYPPPGAVEQLVSPSDIVSCLGKKGTIIFCDTSGFHKGGYSTKTRRLMYAGTFVTDASVQKINYWISESADVSSLHPLARFALGKVAER